MKVEVQLVNPNLAHARGGEVVLYKRPDSKRWQARFKLKDLKWHRVATKHVNLQYAAQTACEAYDRARFLYDEKVPIASKRFDVAARHAIQELEGQIASGTGKTVYNDYITAIKKYLIPFFGNYNLNSIGYDELKKFSTWRVKQMGRAPVQSTVTTHTSALNRVWEYAVQKGWLAQSQVPKMKNNGAKGTAREAFSLSEYKSLTSYMPHWVDWHSPNSVDKYDVKTEAENWECNERNTRLNSKRKPSSRSQRRDTRFLMLPQGWGFRRGFFTPGSECPGKRLSHR